MVKQKKSKSKTKFEEYNKNFAEVSVGIYNRRRTIYGIFGLLIPAISLIIISIVGFTMEADNALNISFLVTGILFVLIFVYQYYRRKQDVKKIKNDKDYAVKYGVSKQTRSGYGYYRF